MTTVYLGGVFQPACGGQAIRSRGERLAREALQPRGKIRKPNPFIVAVEGEPEAVARLTRILKTPALRKAGLTSHQAAWSYARAPDAIEAFRMIVGTGLVVIWLFATLEESHHIGNEFVRPR